MKRRLSSLQCLGKWHAVLLHCLNQCLSYARCQLHYLLYGVCLNQKTGEGRASSQINAFLQMLNLNRQDMSCHATDSVAENGYKFNFDYYPCRDALGLSWIVIASREIPRLSLRGAKRRSNLREAGRSWATGLPERCCWSTFLSLDGRGLR